MSVNGYRKKAASALAAMSVAAALIAALFAAVVPVAAAAADDGIFVPLFTYRKGPFANSGTPLANGMRDYLTLLNERDGGIGGVKLIVEECETEYDPDKGVQCYDAVRLRKPVMVNPWSTPITLRLIARARDDKIPLLTMGYGVAAAARGETFPWVFNPPATYWDGLSMILSHISTEAGGLRRLKDVRFGYIYIDNGYGREAIPLFQAIARELGIDLKLYPVAVTALDRQSELWQQVKADRREYMVMFGYGAMNPVAIKSAAEAGFPMARFFSIWYPTDTDLRSVGDAAIGFKTLNWHNVGQHYLLIQDILKYVVEAKKSLVGSPSEVGELIYNRGVYNSMLIAESIRTAQKLTGKKIVTGEDVRRGLESLDISAERLREIGLDGFTEPIHLSCTDHNGHRPTYIQQWHGTEWLKISGQILPLKSKIDPLLDAAVKDFTEKNQPWPARLEPCDKPN